MKDERTHARLGPILTRARLSLMLTSRLLGFFVGATGVFGVFCRVYGLPCIGN